MITPSLRRTALAAAVAFLAFPAFAQVQGPSAAAGDWVWVGRTAVNLGEHTVQPQKNVVIHTFSYKKQQTAASGEFDYFSILVLAIPVKDGKDEAYLPKAVLLTVTQGRLLPGGSSAVETWHFEASGEGQLEQVTYSKMHTEGTNPTVTDPDVLLDLASPKTKELFEQAVRQAKPR